MRAGPKRAIDVAPLSLRGLPRGGPERVSRFIHRYLKVPRGVGAGKRLQLRPWQLAILDELYTEPRPRESSGITISSSADAVSEADTGTRQVVRKPDQEAEGAS